MKVPKQQFYLGDYDLAVQSRLNQWQETNLGDRIWERDSSVWIPNLTEATATPELTNRLGWLTIVKSMQNEVKTLMNFAAEIKENGFQQVILLGMGGSSLTPRILTQIFGNTFDYLPLTILDSTHPAVIKKIHDTILPNKTLFVVASKSGNTIETLSFCKYFFEVVGQTEQHPGQNFIAITDSDSKLDTLAREKDFRDIFYTPPTIGGRYAALTYFGLVPAALIGFDLKKWLARAMTMVDACAPNIPPDQNPGLMLGAVLGELALAGLDKLTIFTSPALEPFAVWLEQLIAESTGKRKIGLLPIVGEAATTPNQYIYDRIFVYVKIQNEETISLTQTIEGLKAARHPVIEITLADKQDLAQELFRWQFATAAAASVIALNPFDQPNVEASKAKTIALLEIYEDTGQFSGEPPRMVTDALEIYTQQETDKDLAAYIAQFLSQANPEDYLALMAYLPPTIGVKTALNGLRLRLRQKTTLATTLGFGPQLLHSTGQFHKGGRNRGVFIQLTHSPQLDLPIPGENYTFNSLLMAQALGDYQTLLASERRVIRLHLKGDIAASLKTISEAI